MAQESILIVDDETDLRTCIGELLADEGYDVRLACHGLEAWELLQKSHDFSLILLDYMMPFMDARVFRELQLKSSHRDIPTILLTAANLPESVTERLRVNAILRKPVEVDRLLQVVQEHLVPRKNREHEEKAQESEKKKIGSPIAESA